MRNRGQRKIFEEIMNKIFPSLMKVIRSQIQETQHTISKVIKQIKNTIRQIVIKFLKTHDKEKNF